MRNDFLLSFSNLLHRSGLHVKRFYQVFHLWVIQIFQLLLCNLFEDVILVKVSPLSWNKIRNRKHGNDHHLKLLSRWAAVAARATHLVYHIDYRPSSRPYSTRKVCHGSNYSILYKSYVNLISLLSNCFQYKTIRKALNIIICSKY